MTKKNTRAASAARRRGTTIAAAALSVALVAPFVHPVVAPQNAAFAQAEDAAAAPQPDVDGAVNVDAIEDGTITSGTQLSAAQTVAKDVVSGRVNLMTPKNSAILSTKYDGFEGAPDGTKVYFQWKDVDGAESPIYSAKPTLLTESSVRTARVCTLLRCRRGLMQTVRSVSTRL